MEFAEHFDVSRETMKRLETHLATLERWNLRINLVGRSTLPQAWSRHFADSAQLWALRPPGGRRWLDLGSGAGFPGLVIAILAAEAAPGLAVDLVEGDQRKAAFLRAAAQAAGVRVSVHGRRIVDLPAHGADVVSARALAPLSELLPMLEKHRRAGGIGLFPKGGSVHNEIEDAALQWRFEKKIHPSLTEQKAAIVEIGAIERA